MSARHPTSCDYLLHGVRIRVQTGNPELREALARRLQPYHVEAAEPADLVLRFIDGLPPAPACSRAPAAWRTVYELPDGEIRYDPGSDRLVAQVGGVRCVAELGSGTAELGCEAWTVERHHIAAHTLTTVILMERLERLGYFSLHAGCLASAGDGVLIAGPSGAGKSTLALALALEGLDYLADDLVLLSGDGERLRVHGVRDVMGVMDATWQRFPELTSADSSAVMSPRGKRLIRVEETLHTRVADVCRPVMLVFPEISPEPTSSLHPLEPREAWRRLLPDVLLTAPGSTSAHFAAIGALTEGVDCYALRAGSDVRAWAGLIAGRL